MATARASKVDAGRYSTGEEIANAATHGVGVLGGLVALVAMVQVAAASGEGVRIVSAVVFGVSLVFLYLASTLYHALTPPGAKRLMRILDHVGIYLLIAGTYTPFCLVTLEGPWGWSLFAGVWGLALTGIVFEAAWVDRPKWLSALTYVGLGWVALFVIGPLSDALSTTGLWLLFSGGIAYTAGTVFYVAKRVPYLHAVWHLCVMTGSALHALAVLHHVLPVAG